MSKLLIINLLIAFVTICFLIFFFKKKPIFFIRIFCYFFEISNYYFSYKLTNKFLTRKIVKKSSFISSNKFAFIVQGPVIINDNFTEETINYYSRQYPQSLVIFSSWKKDIKRIKQKSFANNVHFLANERPHYAGGLNINLQAISTKNAILFAKKLKCTYILKTRSDCRVGAHNAINYLFYLIRFYTLKNDLPSKQKKRIITTNFTLKHRLYGASDMLMFGHVDDLYKYFDILTSRSLENKFTKFIQKKKFKDNLFFIDKYYCPEIYFFYEYFRKINISLRWTVNDYLKKISQNFIIIDNKTIDLYWRKSNVIDRHFDPNTNLSEKSLEFNFSDWLKFFYKFNKIKIL